VAWIKHAYRFKRWTNPRSARLFAAFSERSLIAVAASTKGDQRRQTACWSKPDIRGNLGRTGVSIVGQEGWVFGLRSGFGSSIVGGSFNGDPLLWDGIWLVLYGFRGLRVRQRNIPDVERIKAWIKECRGCRAVIVGGGLHRARNGGAACSARRAFRHCR
jgi:hypothetical protein